MRAGGLINVQPERCDNCLDDDRKRVWSIVTTRPYRLCAKCFESELGYAPTPPPGHLTCVRNGEL